MRTKSLLLAAAFAAAGVATSMAQVYSVNAVGYVNKTLGANFNLISNPLDAGAGNNTIAKLMANMQGGIPGGLRVFRLKDDGQFESTTYVAAPLNRFNPTDVADKEVPVGGGVFVFVPPAAAPKTVTFVGEVLQGTLNNPLPPGFSIKANMVPQAGAPDTFGLPGAAGDRFFKFNLTGPLAQQYSSSTYVGAPLNRWNPALPSIDVGEAFFFFKAGATPATWTRTFNVNNPA